MTREEIIDIIADLYDELEISDFGFDLVKIIKKLDINLVPYSCFGTSEQRILYNYDEDGFNLINPLNNKIEIFYNDKIVPRRRIKFTLPHELGHIVLGHNCSGGFETLQKKSEANLFAKEFYCPQAFMIHYHLCTKSDLLSAFDITDSYAEILLKKLSQRKNFSLSTNEKRLISIFEKNRIKKD